MTGPTDDGYERDNEWVDNGRLLSNDTKTVYSSNKKQSAELADANTDYIAYQQWLQAKDKNSAEYQKFQKWKEFEEFQRWKAGQKEQ